MDEIYGGGFHSTSGYVDKALMSPENMMIPADQYGYHNLLSSNDHYGYNYPRLGSENLEGNNGFHQCSVASEVASITPMIKRGRLDEDNDEGYSMIKAKIASHPSFSKLLHAYIDCQKIGAPPEIAWVLDEILRENNYCHYQNTVTTCFGADPELDEFMESYCDLLVKYKSDLSRPFHEATSFLNNIEVQLGNLCKDDGVLSSDEELSGRETELQDVQMKNEDQQLKENLLRKYGSHISSLKLEFSKKKKKGKLPKDARQTLLEWWNVHYKWPYPTEADKTLLSELTRLDQKQINNWFINQRKRHWRPSDNMQLAVIDNLSGHFFTDNHDSSSYIT